MNDDQTLELPVRSISPSDIKRYLYHHGWKELPHPRNGLMVFEGPRDDDGEPIIQVIPQSSQSADFAMRARELVNALGIIVEHIFLPAPTEACNRRPGPIHFDRFVYEFGYE